jgi:hypothetical protein
VPRCFRLNRGKALCPTEKLESTRLRLLADDVALEPHCTT